MFLPSTYPGPAFPGETFPDAVALSTREEKSDARLLGLLLRLGHHSNSKQHRGTRIDKGAAFFIVHLVLSGLITLTVIAKCIIYSKGQLNSSRGKGLNSPQD